MNPNQPPAYPPGQYPAPHYPPMYPGMTPQQHYMAQGTPQYPATAPYIDPMRNTVKQEPLWDRGYGMVPGQPVPSNMPQYPGQMPQMHAGMPAQDPSQQIMSTYVSPAGTIASNSLLAQHLAAAPAGQQQPQSSQLHQLLQQPVYPGAPGSQQLMMQQQQQLAEQQRQIQMQNALRLQLQQHQQQMQQQQQQLYQQESVQMHKNSFLTVDPSSQAFPPSHSSTHSAYYRAQEMNAAQALLMPPSRPEPQSIEDFEKMTTGELCILGRELVTDLNSKTSQLSHMLKKVMERKTLNQGENPNDLSDQCRSNLEKMSEIRQIIEKRRAPGWERMSGEDYVTLMLEESEVEEEDKERRAELDKKVANRASKTAPNEGDVWYQDRWIPENLHRKYLLFESNKEKLKTLTNELKALSWKIEVTSPGHLKKVDQTKISKKREENA